MHDLIRPSQPPMAYTYASIVDALSGLGIRYGWRYCLAVPTPEPSAGHILSSLDFVITYANSAMKTHSTFQVDVILTGASLTTGGSTTESSSLSVFRSGDGYRPFILNRDVAESLHSEFGVKYDDAGNMWRHQVIFKSLAVDRCIVPPRNVYVLLHVFEYPTEQTERLLTMDVTATWS
jgi:hypothetical protein